ncbi:hypothetical protein FOA52_015541 [Chlamydomonas sp. UWO 241]|nr:hypothetical protein FOA52_015541 [Chlamydomonas sp. UWO 241]
MKKTFRVSPVNDDGSQFFSVQQTGMPKVNVPVSMAEQAVIRNLVTFALPRLLGFDMVCNSMHTMDGQGTGQF